MASQGDFRCLDDKTVKAEMDPCNSGYKIGCVEPDSFQKLMADRLCPRGNPYLKISSSKCFQQTREFGTNVIVQLHNKTKKKEKQKKDKEQEKHG